MKIAQVDSGQDTNSSAYNKARQSDGLKQITLVYKC